MAKKNLCAMIPEELHARVRQEQEAAGKTLSEYVEQILTEYYEKGGKPMSGDTRTIAFQVPEETFQRLKAYLNKHGLKQKEFILTLIETALADDESEA